MKSDTSKKILLVSGSPRAGGATETLLTWIKSGIEEKSQASLADVPGPGVEIDTFYLSKEEVSPCTSCEGCFTTGECIIHDRMDQFLSFADASNLLIITTPIYFAGVPAQLKAVYDRFQPRWVERYILRQPAREKRPAHLFVVGSGKDPYGYEPAVTTSKSALAILGFSIEGVHDFIGLDADATGDSKLQMQKKAIETGQKLLHDLLERDVA